MTHSAEITANPEGNTESETIIPCFPSDLPFVHRSMTSNTCRKSARGLKSGWCIQSQTEDALQLTFPSSLRLYIARRRSLWPAQIRLLFFSYLFLCSTNLNWLQMATESVNNCSSYDHYCSPDLMVLGQKYIGGWALPQIADLDVYICLAWFRIHIA